MNTETSKPKRVRLSRKQRLFFRNVFEYGMDITGVLQDLHTSFKTLQRWLKKPLFIRELVMYLNQFYLQARMDIARGTPSAISALSTFSQCSNDKDFVRQTCLDILKLQHEYKKADSGVKVDPNGIKLETFGSFLDHLGVKMDQNGAVLDHFGVSKVTDTNTRKPRLKPKKRENIRFPRLLVSSTPVPRPESVVNES